MSAGYDTDTLSSDNDKTLVRTLFYQPLLEAWR